MRYSENYHLYLPEGSDFVSPEQFNSNFNAIDTKLKEVETEAKKVSGHTHAAEEITSGVFDLSRIPFIGNWTGLESEYTVTGLEQEISCGPGTSNVYDFTIPYPAPLSERPKRVLARIGPQAGSNWWFSGPSAEEPMTLILDMQYVGDGLYGTISGTLRVSKAADDGSSSGKWISFPMARSDWAGDDIISYRGSPKGRVNWSGFGGNAFFRSNLAAADTPKELFWFDIGHFSYDTDGIHFRIKETPIPADRDTSTGTLKFRVRMFIFN